jgi:hypothetical protein
MKEEMCPEPSKGKLGASSSMPPSDPTKDSSLWHISSIATTLNGKCNDSNKKTFHTLKMESEITVRWCCCRYYCTKKKGGKEATLHIAHY